MQIIVPTDSKILQELLEIHVSSPPISRFNVLQAVHYKLEGRWFDSPLGFWP